MKYRKLSANGDYVFGQNNQDFYEGADAVTQAIKTSLLLLKGEWWEDLQNGLPLFQSMLSQNGTNSSGVDLLIKERILQVEGVVTITTFKSSLSGRKYIFEAKVQTKYGIVKVGSVL